MNICCDTPELDVNVIHVSAVEEKRITQELKYCTVC